MIRSQLSTIPKIVLLRSDKILHKLISLLLHPQRRIDNDFDVILDGVRDFYPNSYRLDEIELSLSHDDILQSDISSDYDYKVFRGFDYDFSFLQNIYEIYFVRNGSYIYVEDDRVNDYMELISKVSPFQLMGYGLSSKLLKEDINIETIVATVDNYTPLGLRVDSQRLYAENHLHLKGAGYLSFNLSKIITNPTPAEYYDPHFLKEIPRINEFSYINNHQISIGQIVDILKFCKDTIYRNLLNDSDKKQSIDKLSKILSIKNHTTLQNYYSIDHLSKLSLIIPLPKKSIKMKMLVQIIKYYDQDEYSKSYFMENILFFYIFSSTKDIFLQRVIKLYIQAINIIRSYMVMSQNLGLAHFSEYSGSTIRQVERRNANNTAKSIINSGTSKLNAKVGTPKSSHMIAQRVIGFAYAFEREKTPIEFNLGLSSIKEREKNTYVQEYLLPRFYHKRMAIKKETLAIDDFVRNVRYKNVDRFSLALQNTQIEALKNKKKLQGKTIDISSLVVTIDAVGKETHTPPEVFAPHFRYLRDIPEDLKGDIVLGSQTIDQHKRLVMSVHAGEDFNHLITGMRRVDETIVYFGLERRDRIGHLLSLGITPRAWIDNTKEIVVYKGEYFDDLVWMTQKLKYIATDTLSFQWYINRCEDTIWKLFGEIYTEYNSGRLKLVDLYDAWLYRRNCPIVYQQRERGEYVYGEYESRVLDSKKPNENIKKLYELYHTSEKTREAYEQVYRIEKREITDDILDIWEALQDHLLNDIAHKGIVVETNPSSNIFVSSLENYNHHPVFRFCPPKEQFLQKGELFNRFGLRDGKIATTINSDDPSIFVTTLQNEYRLIKNTAKEYYKCSDKEADEWIDEIRVFGLKIFDELCSGNPL